MSPSLAENMLILIGESFWVFGAAVQLRHLVKHKNRDGLSPVSQTLNAAGNIAWMTYFAGRHLWFPFVTNFVLFSLTLAILYLTLHNPKKFRQGLGAIVLIAPLTAVLLISATFLSGWVGMVYNMVAATPWLIHVLGTKKLKGISISGLWYAQGAMACVLAYAILVHALPLIIGCTQGFIYTWIITYRRYKYA